MTVKCQLDTYNWQGSYGPWKFGKVWEKKVPIFTTWKVGGFCWNLEKVCESLWISEFAWLKIKSTTKFSKQGLKIRITAVIICSTNFGYNINVYVSVTNKSSGPVTYTLLYMSEGCSVSETLAVLIKHRLGTPTPFGVFTPKSNFLNTEVVKTYAVKTDEFNVQHLSFWFKSL